MDPWSLWEDAAPSSGAGGEEMAAGNVARGGGAGADPRERHKLAERERRKSMKELFLSLHALLPHATTVRKEQSAILDEIIKYIPVAAARLRSLQSRRHSPAPDGSNNQTATSSASSDNSTVIGAVAATRSRKRQRSVGDGGGEVNGAGDSVDCDIRVAQDASSSVAIRVRGDRVNVSLTDSRGASQAVLLSAVLDELEAHQLDLIRSTHCRDGSKLLHHSESKIREVVDRNPPLLKARLQGLAGKLQGMRKSSAARRPVDQVNSVDEHST